MTYAARMDVTVLGAAGSYPTAAQPASGFLVVAGGARVVLDLGPGTFRELVARVPIHAVDAIVISHGHADHAADLLAWYHAARYGATPRAAVPLLAPDGVVERVGAFLGHTSDELALVFDHRRVEPGSTDVVAGVDLAFGSVAHSVPSVAVRVTVDGRSLVYSGDTGMHPPLARFAHGTDLFVCEATTLDEPVPGQHCDAADAGAMAADADVGALLLTHLREDVDPEAAIARARTRYDGPVAVARSGLTHPIG